MTPRKAGTYFTKIPSFFCAATLRMQSLPSQCSASSGMTRKSQSIPCSSATSSKWSRGETNVPLTCHPNFSSHPISCVRYWRKGLGRALMRLVVETARSTRMWKTMLTVFKRNQPAMNFYLNTGFKIDANSPSSCGHNSECYEILSCK